MAISRRAFLGAAAMASLALTPLYADTSKKITAVYVKDMHCEACARKIASKLYAVPGVVKVSTDVKKGLAVITTQPAKQPSPKALWEAVEEATFEPIKIASPLGTFTSKPKR
jgi:copper chaperone CopZ